MKARAGEGAGEKGREREKKDENEAGKKERKKEKSIALRAMRRGWEGWARSFRGSFCLSPSLKSARTHTHTHTRGKGKKQQQQRNIFFFAVANVAIYPDMKCKKKKNRKNGSVVVVSFCSVFCIFLFILNNLSYICFDFSKLFRSRFQKRVKKKKGREI